MDESSGLRVLIVDDEPDLLEVLSVQFDSAGYQTQIARNGFEALELVQKNLTIGAPFDVIISDLNMPRMNGIELLKTLRRSEIRTPFVFFSGYGDRTEEMINLGATTFVDKPLNLNILLEIVTQAARSGVST